MSELRSQVLRLAASLPQGSPLRQQLKVALLTDGPIGRVLDQHWNTVHDISHDLSQTIRDYADAAHFMGGPAEKDAKEMIKKIEKAQKALDDIASDVFNDLVTDEGKFIGKHGEPGTYSDDMRRKTFPRAASKEARALPPGVTLVENLSDLGPNARLVFRARGSDLLRAENNPGYYLDIGGMLKQLVKAEEMSPAGAAAAKTALGKLLAKLL